MSHVFRQEVQLYRKLQGKYEPDVPTGVTVVVTAHTGNNVQCQDMAGRARCINAQQREWEHVQFKELAAGGFTLKSMRTSPGCTLHVHLGMLHSQCNRQAVSFARESSLAQL